MFSSHLKFQYWCLMPHWRSKNNGQYAPLLFSSHSGSIADRCLLFHSVFFFFASAPFPLFTLPSNEFFLPYVKKPFASRLLVAQSHFTPTNFSLCISLAFLYSCMFSVCFFFKTFFFIYLHRSSVYGPIHLSTVKNSRASPAIHWDSRGKKSEFQREENRTKSKNACTF